MADQLTIEYEPGSGRITRTSTGWQLRGSTSIITVPLAELPADFSPRKYVVKDGALAISPAWVDPANDDEGV